MRRAFHGTRPSNVSKAHSSHHVPNAKSLLLSQIKKICDKGLLRVGHPLNPSMAIDEGFFGMPQHGVYVSRYADYTFKVWVPFRAAGCVLIH